MMKLNCWYPFGSVRCLGIVALAVAIVGAFDGWAVPIPDPVDGIVTLAVQDGSVTYDTGALSSQVTKVCKTGAGQAIIAVESPNFIGTTEVKGGTLTLKAHKALGPIGSTAVGGDITVENGATLYLNWPGIGQATYIWTKRTVTISGTGADGKGAIRIEPTAGESNPMNDRVFGTIALSGDATVTSTQRWGFSVAFKFNTYTLTRNGSGLMMFVGKFYGPGNIVLNSDVKKAPTNVASFQESTSFDGFSDGTSTITCNAGACVTMSKVRNPIPFNFVFASSNAYVFASNNGTAPNEDRNLNVITGDITFPARTALNSDVIAFSQAKSSAGNRTFMTWKGKVTQQEGTLLNKTGAGTIVIDGRFDGAAANGSSGYRFQASDGSLIFGPNADVRNLYPANYNVGKGQLLFEGGRIHLTGSGLGAYGGGSKVKPTRQTGGSIAVVPDSAISASDNTYGSYYIEGGDVTFSNVMYISAAKELSNGFLVQRGGLIRSPVSGKLQSYGQKGQTVYYQCGGTNDSCYTGRGADRVLVNASSGSALMAITGSNTLFKTERFQYAYGDDGDTCFNLSLSDGATLSLDRFMRCILDNPVHDHPAYVYVDGGIMHIRTSNGLTDKESSNTGFYRANPTHFVIGPHGLVFDTTDCIQQVGPSPVYYKSYIPFALEKTVGMGVSRIVLPDTDAFKALNYYSPMRIEIEGDGFGAAAFADWDFETSSLVIRITNPGCGYTKANTTVKIVSPDLATWYDCDFELSEFACGPLTVKGQGVLLYNSASTFDGGVVVEKGSYVRMVNPGSVPDGNALAVYGEFNIFTNNLVVSSVAGNGVFSCNGGAANGNVTLAENGTIHLKASDLFAADSTALRFPRRFTMSRGARIVLDDPENLPEERTERKTFLMANNLEIIDGTVPQLDGVIGNRWRVSLCDNGNSLCLVQKSGLILIVQ